MNDTDVLVLDAPLDLAGRVLTALIHVPPLRPASAFSTLLYSANNDRLFALHKREDGQHEFGS